MADKVKLSTDARVLMSSWFRSGHKTKVEVGGAKAKSRLTERAKAALTELEGHGFIASRQVRDDGRMEFQGTDIRCTPLSIEEMERHGAWSPTEPNPEAPPEAKAQHTATLHLSYGTPRRAPPMTDSKTPDWAKEEARDVESWWSNGGKSISTRDLLQQRISQALLSAYERGKAERGWQPIETAPRDGTVVTLWRGERGWGAPHAMDGARWKDDHWWWRGGKYTQSADRITHWMPLVAPPTKENDNER